MAEKSNTGVVIAVVIGIVVVGGVVVYLVMKSKTAPKTKLPPGTTPGTQTPIGLPATSSTPGFPIPYGATGQLVKNLQEGLNQYEGVNIVVDGIFGKFTGQALAIAGTGTYNETTHTITGGAFDIPVSQSDYNDIIAPPTVVTSEYPSLHGAPEGTTYDASTNSDYAPGTSPTEIQQQLADTLARIGSGF